MAKLKLNFGGDWKGLLLAHGEKIGLAVVGVLVVMFLLSAMGQEGLPDAQAPANLSALAEQAKSHIDGSVWEDYPQRPELPPIGPQSIMKPLELASYDARLVLDPPLFPRKVKREDPPLLAAVQLEVHSGYGPFALYDETAAAAEAEFGRPSISPRSGGLFGRRPRGDRGLIDQSLIGEEFSSEKELTRPLPDWLVLGGVRPGGDDKVEGRRWVVVNALVPIAKQQEEFDRTFQDAEGHEPTADRPLYLAYYIERAVISGPGEPKWEPLATMTPNLLAEATSEWSREATAEEIVDPRYLNPRLVYPLGPLVMRDWDEQVTHSEVPLAPTEEELQEMMDEQAPFEEQPEEEQQPDLYDQFSLGPRDDEGGLTPRRGGLVEPGMRAPLRRRGGGMRERGTDLLADEKPAQSLLLRYFDFNVQPGKRYQYRVRLVMRDPNFHRSVDEAEPQTIPVKYLDKTVIDRIKETQPRMRPFRFTDWSEPSSIVEPELEHGVLAAGVTPASDTRFNDRPSAQVLVKEFDQTTGMEAAVERTMARSGTALFTADVETIDPKQRQLVKLEQYEFDVQSTLLDLRGGKELGGRGSELTEPGEMLFLDPQGNLRVHRELADRERVQFHRDLLHEAAPLEEGKLFGGPGISGMEPGMLVPEAEGRRQPRRGSR